MHERSTADFCKHRGVEWVKTTAGNSSISLAVKNNFNLTSNQQTTLSLSAIVRNSSMPRMLDLNSVLSERMAYLHIEHLSDPEFQFQIASFGAEWLYSGKGFQITELIQHASNSSFRYHNFVLQCC